MNSTPQEKVILRKFYKYLNQNVFSVYVHSVVGITPQPKTHIIYIGIYPSIRINQDPVFTGYYNSQKEALDKAEEVCIMVLFDVQQ